MPNAIAKTGWPSSASGSTDPDRVIAVGTAAVDIFPGDSIYLKISDGLWHPTDATGAAASASTNVLGQAAQLSRAGEAVTLSRGHNMAYPTGSSCVPGTPLYLSATIVGGYDDTAAYSGAPVVGYVIKQDMILFRWMP